MSVSRPTLGQARRLETAQISLNRSFNVELLDTKSFNRPFTGTVLTDLDLSHKLLTTSNSYSIINTVQDVLFYDHETGVISGQKVKTLHETTVNFVKIIEIENHCSVFYLGGMFTKLDRNASIGSFLSKYSHPKQTGTGSFPTEEYVWEL